MGLVTRTPPNNNKVDHGRVLKLHLRGMTEPEIGKVIGCSRQYVNQVLRPFKGIIRNPEAIETYRQNEADLIDGARMSMLKSMLDRASEKKDALPAYTMAYGILFDKQRLIRGESTQNVSVHTAIEQIQSDITSLRAKRDAILDKLSK